MHSSAPTAKNDRVYMSIELSNNFEQEIRIFIVPWAHKFRSYYCMQVHAHERLGCFLEQDYMFSTAPLPQHFLRQSSRCSCSVLKPLCWSRSELELEYRAGSVLQISKGLQTPSPSDCLGHPQKASEDGLHYVTWDINRHFLKDPAEEL